MVVSRAYDFHLVDVLLDVVCLFFLFPVYIASGSHGGIDSFRAFQLRDGGTRARRGGGVAFYGDCRITDLFATHGRDYQFGKNFCIADAWDDDIVVYRGWCVVFVTFADI